MAHDNVNVLALVNSNTFMHYNNVIIGAIASQVTSLTIAYATVYSSADHRKHQSSASMASVRRIHRWLVNSPHKWPVTRKMYRFDYVIMIKIDHYLTAKKHSKTQTVFIITLTAHGTIGSTIHVFADNQGQWYRLWINNYIALYSVPYIQDIITNPRLHTYLCCLSIRISRLTPVGISASKSHSDRTSYWRNILKETAGGAPETPILFRRYMCFII